MGSDMKPRKATNQNIGRPRGQSGHLEETGTKVKRWKAHWFVYELDEEGKEVRKKRARVIGRKPGGPANLPAKDLLLPELTKFEAQQALQKIIDKESGILRGGSTAKASSSVGFGWFTEKRWLPLREPRWKASTKSTNLHIIRGYILPAWERTSLRDLDVVAVSEWLSRMAQEFSPTIVHKCRVYMKAITAEAVDQEYLHRDPLRKLPMPRMTEPEKPTLSIEEIRRLIASFDAFRDQVIFLVLMLVAVRPAEAFALKWGDWNQAERTFWIRRGVVQGVVDTTKTRKSRGRVAIPEHLNTLIEQWRLASKRADPDDWIFPSERNTPLRLGNWNRRYLKAAAKKARIEVSPRMLRRSFATIAHESGVSMKAVQAQLRHASMATTSDVYTQAPEAFVSEAVEIVAKKIVNGSGSKKD